MSISIIFNRQTKYIIAAVLTASVPLLSPSWASAESKMVFEDSFEKAKVGQNLTGDKKWGGCSGNCPIVTNEQARSGKNSLKSHVSRTKSKIKFRTEVVPRGELRTNTRLGEHYWYGVSIFIPNHHIQDNLAGDVLIQWSDNANGKLYKPVLTLKLEKSKWVIGSRINPQNGSKTFSPGNYQTGVWVDWVFHVKWSEGKDGILEVWKDSKKVADLRGANNYNNSNAPYMKMGLYKTEWRPVSQLKTGSKTNRYNANIFERTFYHDELRIAKGSDASYADVAPGNGNGNGNKANDNKLNPPKNLKIK